MIVLIALVSVMTAAAGFSRSTGSKKYKISNLWRATGKIQVEV
jgi:hypothetical protein